jgi:hypothetical protein
MTDAVLDPNFLERNCNIDYWYFFVYNSILWTHDLYGHVRNAFDAGKSIMRASERGLQGLGSGNETFLDPRERASRELGECHLGPQKVAFSNYLFTFEQILNNV